MALLHCAWKALCHRIHLFHVGIWTTAIENVLVGLARNEGPDQGGLPKRGEALEQTVKEFRSACDLSMPVLFVIHGGDQAVFSMGGTIDRSEVETLRTRLSDPRAILRLEDRMEGQKLLATMEVPW